MYKSFDKYSENIENLVFSNILLQADIKKQKGKFFYKYYKTIEKYGFKKGDRTIFDSGLENLEKTIKDLRTIKNQYPENQEQLEEIRGRLIEAENAYLILFELFRNLPTVTAKLNRDKRVNRDDPSKQKAIDEAIRLWGINPNLSLDDVAERIRKDEITSKSHSTVKNWILPHNPKRKRREKPV